MKRYLIHDTIYFYPDERKIEAKADGRIVTLHTPASLCLVKLLESAGEVTTQSDLLQTGWGDELAKHTTQASYYQCFVNLRKNFCSLGFTEKLLITIPRRGMQVNPLLNIESENISNLVSLDLTTETESETEQGAEETVHKEKYTKKIIYAVLTTASISLLIIACYYLFFDVSYFDRYQTVSGLDDCYHFDDPTADDTANTVEKLKKHGYGCGMDKQFFIHKLRNAPRLTFYVCDKAESERCYSVTMLDK